MQSPVPDTGSKRTSHSTLSKLEELADLQTTLQKSLPSADKITEGASAHPFLKGPLPTSQTCQVKSGLTALFLKPSEASIPILAAHQNQLPGILANIVILETLMDQGINPMGRDGGNHNYSA